MKFNISYFKYLILRFNINFKNHLGQLQVILKSSIYIPLATGNWTFLAFYLFLFIFRQYSEKQKTLKEGDEYYEYYVFTINSPMSIKYSNCAV